MSAGGSDLFQACLQPDQSPASICGQGACLHHQTENAVDWTFRPHTLQTTACPVFVRVTLAYPCWRPEPAFVVHSSLVNHRDSAFRILESVFLPLSPAFSQSPPHSAWSLACLELLCDSHPTQRGIRDPWLAPRVPHAGLLLGLLFLSYPLPVILAPVVQPHGAWDMVPGTRCLGHGAAWCLCTCCLFCVSLDTHD